MSNKRRRDESVAAERLVAAIREGRIGGLRVVHEVECREVDDDPPDLLLKLDGREVGVELARVIEPEYAAGISADLRTLAAGRQPDPVVWKPDVPTAIASIVRSKTKKYSARRVVGADWLVLHDSTDRPGWYDQPVEGHAWFAEQCAAALSECRFELVILQSTYRGEEQWSVLFSSQGAEFWRSPPTSSIAEHASDITVD